MGHLGVVLLMVNNVVNAKNPGIQVFNPTTGTFNNVVLQKGQILTFDGNLNQYVPFDASSTNGDVLIANSTEDAGLDWADPASLGGGTIELLQHQSFSGVTEVDFTSQMSSNYDVYMVMYNIGVDEETQINFRLSTDNGSTFLNSGYSAFFMFNAVPTTDVLLTVPNTTLMRIAGITGMTNPTSNNPNHRAFGQLHLFGVNDATNKQAFNFAGYRRRTDGNPLTILYGACYQTTTSVVNAIRFFCNSGEMNGHITLYGYIKP